MVALYVLYKGGWSNGWASVVYIKQVVTMSTISNDIVEDIVNDLLEEVEKVARTKEGGGMARIKEGRGPVKMAVEGAAQDIRGMGMGMIYYFN